jgi:rod shape-determining protein MreC
MLDTNSPDFISSADSREGSGVHGFLANHGPFFFLVVMLAAQLLLLSFQVTRNRNVRLIRFWAVVALDPFERSLWGMLDASTRTWRTYRDLWQAQKQNQELRAQLLAARAQIQQLTEQSAESQRLRGLLTFKNHLPLQTVAAEVIATSPGEYSNAVFIDKGADSGLTPDLAVITPEGIVGKIIAVFPRSSHVLLITDPSSGAAVVLAGSRLQGILKGANPSLCQIHYIMNDEEVSSGESALTSGLDQIYPKGLPVGKVVQVGAGNIYKNIIVKPAVDFNRLESVLVVLKSGSNR